MKKFREKIPKFAGKKIALFGVYVLFIFVSSFSFLLFFDFIPLFFNSDGTIWLWIPVIGVLSLEIIGLILVYQMWFWRERLKQKYGELSYQKVFLVGFAGILMLITISFHTFIPFYFVNSKFWSSNLYYFFTTPFTSFFLSISLVLDIIRVLIGVIITIIAILMMFRSLITFGFDYMTVTYLYFPEESSLQNNEIYSVIRHPMYSGLIILCFGGYILHFNLYSALFFIIYYLGFSFHIIFVEDKELIKRFGDSYKKYKNDIPAFFPYPNKLKTLFKFIFTKND